VNVVQGSSTSNYLSRASLIGSTVTWLDNKGKIQSGTVDSVTVASDGSAQLMVNGQTVNANKITSISSPSQNNGLDQATMTAISMIGSTVTYLGSDGHLYSNKVNAVKMVNGSPCLLVGDNNDIITMNQVQSSS